MAKSKKQRRHGDLPAGWQWRDGRPRWIPSPTLRGQGWKGRDLKDRAGRWLERGGSIDAAAAIVAAVQAWRQGGPVPAEASDIAPAGAARPAPAQRRGDPFSIGALLAAYQGSDEFARLARATQADYRKKLKRLVDVLSGWTVLPDKADAPALARWRRDVDATLACSVFSLEPAEGRDGLVDLLHGAYWQLHREAGVHMASGVMACASAWLGWCRERRSRRILNWAGEISRETPPGRLHPLSFEAVKALFDAAEALGWASIADAIVLGVDLSWSQVDRLMLTWDRVADGRAFTARQKTGRVGGTPFLDMGNARLIKIRERQLAMRPKPTHVLWCEATHQPWSGDLYRKKFALVRAHAALTCPEVLQATDADLRDTAITWQHEAELTADGMASRSLQSLRRINDLHDRHYGEIGPAIADPARDKLNAMMASRGWLL